LLHLAQAALDLLQALGHQLERGVQARGECALQLLVHRLAHLLQLGRVVLLQRAQLLLEGGAHLAHALLVARGQPLQALVQALGEALLRLQALLAGHARVLHQAGAQRRQLLAEGLDAGILLAAELVQLRAHVAQPLRQQLAQPGLRLDALGPALARVLGERVAQLVQAGVGAGAQVGQVAGEAVDALPLGGAQAVQLLAQLQAAVAQFLAQGLLQLRAQPVQGRLRPAQEQGQEQGEGGQQQAGHQVEQGGVGHGHSLPAAVSGPATAGLHIGQTPGPPRLPPMARAARQPIRLKRVYDPAEPGDGQRLLVDGVWPRGKTKQELAIEAWLRSLAPSAGLRRWFGHDPARWEDFRARYFEELAANPDGLARLRAYLDRGPVTLLYAARDEEHNNAVALRDFLMLARRSGPAGRQAGATPRTLPGVRGNA